MTQWLQGLSPPQYKEVGPFSFRAKEVRYNVNFDANWNEVEYTCHQWAEYMPASSCAECTMDANITSINRGYLQFLSSSTSPVDPETAVIYATMPMTLSIITGITTNMIVQFEPNASTIAYDSIRQWTDCSFLLVSIFYFIYCLFICYYQSRYRFLYQHYCIKFPSKSSLNQVSRVSFMQPLQASLNLQQPYLKDVPLPPGTPPLVYDLELCAYIPRAIMNQMGIAVTPSQFGTYGLDMNYTATSTFLSLAIGKSNVTFNDPAASSFIQAFLTMPQTSLISTISTINSAAAAALGLLTQSQWLLLQGYLASLVDTWGATVVSEFLQANGGGLVVTKNVNEWLYGKIDWT